MIYKVHMVCDYVFNVEANSEAEARSIAKQIDSKCFEYGWCYENAEDLQKKYGFEYCESSGEITEINTYANGAEQENQ